MITSSDKEQPYNYGWNTTSQDYHAHVSRSPSVVTDFPRYPNVHKIFNNKVTYYEDKTPPPINQQQHHSPQARKKVHFVEQDQVVKAADDNNKNGENVYGDSIDAEADGFIKQKHQKFELAKWDTFKSLY